jgi:hypothetical protein
LTGSLAGKPTQVPKPRLSITSRNGHWPDIAYHASVLPILAVAFVALLRPPDASGTTETAGAPLTGSSILTGQGPDSGCAQRA